MKKNVCTILFSGLLLVAHSGDSGANDDVTGPYFAPPVNVGQESKAIALGSFEIAIPEGWQYETKTQPNMQVVTQIFHPDKEGVLQIGSIISLPGIPTQNRMRLLTNLDSSVDLTWQKWGELSGYQYDYTEAGKLISISLSSSKSSDSFSSFRQIILTDVSDNSPVSNRNISPLCSNLEFINDALT